MKKAAITGVGITKFGKSAKTQVEMFSEAATDAMNDAGVAPNEIEAFYFGNALGMLTEMQGHMAPLMASNLGLPNIPASRFENACASGAVAFRHAYMAVSAGYYDIVLVGGSERVLTVPTAQSTEYFAYASDYFYETNLGISFPGHYALVARAHMKKHGTTEEQLAHVAVKNHFHGARNPKAQFQKEIKVEDVLKSAKVADPLKLYDCCPFSDGAAAAILVSEKVAKKHKDAVYITGSAQASDYLSLTDRPDMTRLMAAEVAARDAYKQAKVEPKDVDVAEVHDCFTIAEIVALEGLGFYPPGKGGKSAQEGETYVGGRIPVNPSGGLKAKGHPIGATGVAQVVEITAQLRGKSHNQVKGAEIGLAHNVGGSGGTAIVHILRGGK